MINACSKSSHSEMPCNLSPCVTSISFILGQFPTLKRINDTSFQRTSSSKCPKRRPRRASSPRMLFADPVHTMPEIINHIIVSCGIGLAGIVGAKATEEVRALTSGDRRADYFDALARDVDSVRRRRELSAQAGDRDWSDVTVDKFSNVLVVPEEVPEIESHDDLREFDRLLRDSPASKRTLRNGDLANHFRQHLPDASEFEMDDE